MKQPEQAVETASDTAEPSEPSGNRSAVSDKSRESHTSEVSESSAPSKAAAEVRDAASTVVEPMIESWSEMIKRQSEGVMQAYSAMFAHVQNPHLKESTAAGHALARSQSAIARLREVREASEVLGIWGELTTSASAFLLGYWQQMMSFSLPNHSGATLFLGGAVKPDGTHAFGGAWPLGFDAPASMFKLFSAPLNLALQAAGRDGPAVN